METLHNNSSNTINGAIDYIILKNNSKYIIFFLDNHAPSSYCQIPSKNIDSLFEDFMNKNSIFILEEIIGYNKYINTFNNTEHLNKYLQFYNKYKSNNKIIPIDIRLLFNNFDENDKFSNLDQLFDISSCTHTDIIKIKNIIDKCKNISNIFLKHYDNLKNKYIDIKNKINNNNEYKKELICNTNYLEYIILDYPFVDINENICNHIDIFSSSLLELYGIAQIELSLSKYNIIYLGASHCLSMFNILEKYYGYRKVKGLKSHNLISLDRFHLNLLDSFDKSCIDFIDL
jgi:hypothetical protein